MNHEAMLYEKKKDGLVLCQLCPHHCLLKPEQYGLCKVRQNIDGVLYSHVYGQIIAAHVDPIEKKPLHHFLPGTRAYSIATRGCNFQCGFCQNWQISQASSANSMMRSSASVSPEQIVREALKSKSASIAYTYTEPTIYFEYAYDTACLAQKAGLANIFVTNGFMSGLALEKMAPYLDAANVDLKSYNPDFYKKICKGALEPVLDTIRMMKQLKIWIEITTLLVPGQNDGTPELTKIAEFIADTGREIPWHISRFHPDYTFTDSEPTPLESMYQAREIGQRAGLKYIYLGNIPERADTHCPNCSAMVVERSQFSGEARFTIPGQCPSCQTIIEGVWIWPKQA
ncbi:AmmeMemoRadiSam system radical SAM enzyme [bacterium]|nr:AmmeMemoRadiSam system radical SAM enzyme [bacterium]